MLSVREQWAQEARANNQTVESADLRHPSLHSWSRVWDSAIRAYVPRSDEEDMAMTTFGPLKNGCIEIAEIATTPYTNDNVNEHGVFVGEPGASAYLRKDDMPRRGSYISTFTGRFWPMDPRASEVRIEDIAHSLAMQCRYAGHGRRFYSVAEHSVHVARRLMDCGWHTALTGLLHDAPEAYLVDVPRPVKRALVGYKVAEEAVWLAIAEAFDLDAYLPTVVHIMDSRIIADEMQQNMHEVDPAYNDPLGIELQFWSPPTAELYFLDMFRKLTAEKMGVAA